MSDKNSIPFDSSFPPFTGRALLSVKVVLVGLAISALFAVILILAGSSRSFLVQAETQYLSLEFGTGSNSWRLNNAELCVPTGLTRIEGLSNCGPLASSDGPPSNREIFWKEGQKIAVEARKGGVRIEILNSDDSGFPEGAFFLLDKAAWRNTGALTFIGHAEIGQDMTSGLKAILTKGTWEARERGALTSILRSSTEVVKSGTLSLGTTAGIVLHNNEKATVYGHVSFGDGKNDDNFSVKLVSEFGETAIEVRHFGVTEPLILRPDWVDVAIGSPLILAVTALIPILALVGNSVGLFMFYQLWNSSDLQVANLITNPKGKTSKPDCECSDVEGQEPSGNTTAQE